MRNSLLYGVPTNDQLVLHLLRVGERQGVPLPRPPPPPLSGTPKEQIKDNAPDPDDELVDEDGNRIDVNDLAMKDKVMHKSKSKIVGGLKSLSKRVAGIGADVTVDGVKKQVGSKVDRMIWGDMLKDDGDPECESGTGVESETYLLTCFPPPTSQPTLVDSTDSTVISSSRPCRDTVSLPSPSTLPPSVTSTNGFETSTTLSRSKRLESRSPEPSSVGLAGRISNLKPCWSG